MSREIYLRAFEFEDLDFINGLRNSNEFFDLTCGNKYFISSEYNRKWIENKISNNHDQLYLMISTIDGNQRIGYHGVSDIDYINRKAQLNSIVIDSKFSSKGYGFQSSILILNHLFYELGMNMIYLYIRTDQLASLKISEKLGFQNSGLLRSFVYKQNKFHDAYLLSVLKEDYDKISAPSQE